MELIEINSGFQINVGAPEPIIISNDNELFIAFYADKKASSTIPQENNVIDDTEIFTLEFKQFLKYTFGMPNNETIHGHPYSKLGMNSYSFYELKNSDLIKTLQNIEKVHPQYNPKKWEMYRHYILTFHDNMFECIAQGFEIREENISLYDKVVVLLKGSRNTTDCRN